MKLSIIMPSGTLHGGAEQALLDFIGEAAAQGTEIQRVIFLEAGELVNQIKAAGIAVSVIEAGRLRDIFQLMQTIRKLRSLLLSDAPELVLSWMTKAHIYGGLAARLAKIPASYFQMGLPDGGSVDRLSRWIPARAAVGCSEFVARAQGRKVRHPVIGVPLAADFSRFTQVRSLPANELKERLGFDASCPLIGIVGRLQTWKGMHVFAEAMQIVLTEMPQVQGVIVGGQFHLEPEYEGFLKERLSELGIEQQVRMVGAQKNIPEWMQAMDIVVHASEREPFGIVIVEAMSLGKPVIATRPGGPEEIITHDEDGLLVEWNSPSMLADAILRFLRDKELAARCGQAAKKRADSFTPERYAERLTQALDNLMKPRCK